MDGTVVSQLLGQTVPLTAATHTEDYSIQHTVVKKVDFSNKPSSAFSEDAAQATPPPQQFRAAPPGNLTREHRSGLRSSRSAGFYPSRQPGRDWVRVSASPAGVALQAPVSAELADYIREELGFPGARQGAIVERVRVAIATGEVTRERRYLLTSLSPRECGPRELLRLFRNHWSIESSQHHVKDPSWDEDVHTLRRPGLGEVFAALVNTGLNALRLEGWFPPLMSMPLRAKCCAFRPMQTIDRLYGRDS